MKGSDAVGIDETPRLHGVDAGSQNGTNNKGKCVVATGDFSLVHSIEMVDTTN